MIHALPLVAIAVLTRVHWAGPLVVGALWWIAQTIRVRSVVLPRHLLGLALALCALVTSTALSRRPSALAWMGMLQWLSLLVGALVVNAELRRSPKVLDGLMASLVAVGTVDMVLWSREVVLRHWEWWILRVDGLPLFPFRVRLFGSHGSTQAALWLVVVFLVGVFWLLPRARDGWRILVIAWLSWCAILLGFCDSRLAMAGALFSVCYAGVLYDSWKLPWGLLLFSNGIWLWRDWLHPSRILEGGGVDQGAIQCFLALVVPALILVASRIRLARVRKIWALAAVAVGIFALATVLLHPAGDAKWSTGRLQFWRVGLEGLVEHPFLGNGPWSFPWLYSMRVDWSREFLAMHPHNWVLEVLSTGGLLLLGTLTWLFLGRYVPKDEGCDPGQRTLPLIGMALGIGMAFDSPQASPQVLLVAILVGGWVLSRQSKFVEIRPGRVWALSPLLLLVPLAHVSEGIAGKHLLVEAAAIDDSRQRAKWILESMPLPTSDPQWRREEVMARTTLVPDDRDSLKAVLVLWDRLILEEPTYSPNLLHREYLRFRLGEPSRLDELLESQRSVGWQRPFVPTVRARWRGTYPTDSASYWLRKTAEWRKEGKVREVRWVANWFRETSTPHSCAELSWATVLGWPGRGIRTRSVVQEHLYGSLGSGETFVPTLQVLVQERCLRNLRNDGGG